jgi:hypothetical protein
VLADCIKMGCFLLQLKENLKFYNITLQKCKYDGLKLILGIQIQISLDPDLFGQLCVLQGAMAVLDAIFNARTPIQIRVVANLQDLSSLILHLWMHCSTDCNLKTANF